MSCREFNIDLLTNELVLLRAIISKAKLEAGTITQEKFDNIKKEAAQGFYLNPISKTDIATSKDGFILNFKVSDLAPN